MEIDSNNEFLRLSSIFWVKEMVNIVYLIGNVGWDMEIKYLDIGKVVVKFSLVVEWNLLKKDEFFSWYGVVVNVFSNWS